LGRALEVTTAVLVVTCPCAFGIATPLAYELVVQRLRRAGLFVKSATLLDRLREVRRIVFDKTGTLTSGLCLSEPERLESLDPEALVALSTLVFHSNHPKSEAVRRALSEHGSGLDIDAVVQVRETLGAGLAVHLGEHDYRLGSPAFAARRDRTVCATGSEPEEQSSDLCLSRDGKLLLALETEEALRPGTSRELQRLAERGYELWILSGDSPERTRALGQRVGIPADHCRGGASPEDKASFLDELDAGDTLTLGDGVNDALAVSRSHVSGTPAIDRPFMPARTDFYLVTPGLGSLDTALSAASELRRVIRGNLGFAVFYNALTVGLCFAGLMQPWLAAVLMPLSSVSVLAMTRVRLGQKRAPKHPGSGTRSAEHQEPQPAFAR
jgi:Cu2+-exporting ATPase